MCKRKEQLKLRQEGSHPRSKNHHFPTEWRFPPERQICLYIACFYVAIHLWILAGSSNGSATVVSTKLSGTSLLTLLPSETGSSQDMNAALRNDVDNHMVPATPSPSPSLWDCLWPFTTRPQIETNDAGDTGQAAPIQPLHFLVYSHSNEQRTGAVDELLQLQRANVLPQDLHISIVSATTTSSSAVDAEEQGNDDSAAMFRSFLAALEAMEPNSLVVLSTVMSDGEDGATLNHHLRSEEDWSTELERERTALLTLLSKHSTATHATWWPSWTRHSSGSIVEEDAVVIVSTTSTCCAPSLHVMPPGSTAFRGTQSGRNVRTNAGPRPCRYADGDQEEENASHCNDSDASSTSSAAAAAWTHFMQERAKAAATSTRQNQDEINEDDSAETKSKTSTYLEGTLIAGTARHLIHLLTSLDIQPGDEVHMILADYWYQFPHRVVLDYEHQLFGPRFDGVVEVVACDEDANVTTTTVGSVEKPAFVRSTSPLFLYSSRRPMHECRRRKSYESKSFPVWDESLAGSKGDPGGIPIRSVLDHLHQVYVDDVTVDGIDRCYGKETFYIVDRHGFWGTENTTRDEYRALPTEAFLVRARDELLRLVALDNSSTNENDDETSRLRQRWKALYAAMQDESSTSGFPYWAWYGDWKRCNLQNNGNESIPLFTTSAPVTCHHSFPTPSYANIIVAKSDANHWHNIMVNSSETYPWASKFRKVVWRGTLSERNHSLVFESQRWRLCKFVHELTDPTHKAMFDVGLTHIPGYMMADLDIDPSLAGGIVEPIHMRHFQNYTIVLDMDGDSWSSRFGTLLCQNSAVIKVEPAYVDDFFWTLVPWKHYIPIKNDLSDLLETTAFVLDPANDDLIREIVASANHWCSVQSTQLGLVYDMLDVWEYYVRQLDLADPNWRHEWAVKKQALLAPSSRVSFIELQS